MRKPAFRICKNKGLGSNCCETLLNSFFYQRKKIKFDFTQYPSYNDHFRKETQRKIAVKRREISLRNTLFSLFCHKIDKLPFAFFPRSGECGFFSLWGLYVSDLYLSRQVTFFQVKNSKDRFSHYKAHISYFFHRQVCTTLKEIQPSHSSAFSNLYIQILFIRVNFHRNLIMLKQNYDKLCY